MWRILLRKVGIILNLQKEGTIISTHVLRRNFLQNPRMGTEFDDTDHNYWPHATC